MAAFDVLVGIEGVLHLDGRGRRGHELHQPARTPARHGPRVELGLGLDDRRDQDRRDVMAHGDLPDVRLDRDRQELAPRLLDRVLVVRRLALDLSSIVRDRPRRHICRNDREQQDQEPEHVRCEQRSHVAHDAWKRTQPRCQPPRTDASASLLSHLATDPSSSFNGTGRQWSDTPVPSGRGWLYPRAEPPCGKTWPERRRRCRRGSVQRGRTR